MKRYIKLILIVLVWAFSVINTSGWGIMYDTPIKTNIIIVVCFLWLSLSGKQKLPIGDRNLVLIFFTVLSFIVIPYFSANSWDGFTYLLMIPFVYCFSQQSFTNFDLQTSGYIVASLGIMTLYIYNRTDVLSGWNDNQIGMIGLFSYLYYSISLFGKITFRKLSIGIAISAAYIVMLTHYTESRSIAIFIFLSLAFAYWGSIMKKLLKNKRFIFLSLSFPLFIAVIVVLFPHLEIFQSLDKWSEQNYGKSIFNGRDELWLYTFNRLPYTYYLGDGRFLINYHNSAMAALGVFGIIGYICWYKLLSKPIMFMVHFLNDDIVFGCLMAFLLIFWQQSFDLGFISETPNMFPYMILGIGLGRIRTIRLYGKN